MKSIIGDIKNPLGLVVYKVTFLVSVELKWFI
jgi:hypothetical protein